MNNWLTISYLSFHMEQQQTVQQLQIQAPQIQQTQGTKITTHIPTVAAGQPQVTQQPQQQQLIQLQQQVQGGVTQVLPSVATIVQAAHSIQASRTGTVCKSLLNQTIERHQFRSYFNFNHLPTILASTTATNGQSSSGITANIKYHEHSSTCSDFTSSTNPTVSTSYAGNYQSFGTLSLQR